MAEWGRNDGWCGAVGLVVAHVNRNSFRDFCFCCKI